MHFVYGGLHCTIWKLLSRGGRPKWKCVVRGCSLPRGALRARASRAPSALLKMENGKFCTTINRKTSATTFATTADWRTSSLHPPDSTFAFSGFSDGEITAPAISGRRFFGGAQKKRELQPTPKTRRALESRARCRAHAETQTHALRPAPRNFWNHFWKLTKKGGGLNLAIFEKVAGARDRVRGATACKKYKALYLQNPCSS